MKPSIQALHKAFDNRLRLGVMAILAVNDQVDFTALKSYLEVTDGNLASHLKALEKEQFIAVQKSFIGRKPNTTYSITEEGRIAFNAHLQALEQFIQFKT